MIDRMFVNRLFNSYCRRINLLQTVELTGRRQMEVSSRGSKINGGLEIESPCGGLTGTTDLAMLFGVQ